MNQRVKIKVTTNGVVTTDLNEVMDAKDVQSFIEPYETSKGDQKTEISITKE